MKTDTVLPKLDQRGAVKIAGSSYENYKASFLPKLLGWLLIASGNLLYGTNPSYKKFRAIEIVARTPYFSWESAIYSLLSCLYFNEKKALKLSELGQFSRFAQDNETMHVIVLSQIVKKEGRGNFILHSAIPFIFSFLYYVAVFIIYLIKPRYALELNYTFEQHAVEQYTEFLKQYETSLKQKTITSEFLRWYGRNPKNLYVFFESVRNDEIDHRNRSIESIALAEK